MNIQFVWDKNKDSANKRKHNIAFDEAKTVFLDEYARLIYDNEHSEDEDRFILLGTSYRLRLLVVCHCYKTNDHVIRIFSARKASKREEMRYYEKRV